MKIKRILYLFKLGSLIVLAFLIFSSYVFSQDIVYASNARGTQDIWVMNSDGSNKQNLSIISHDSNNQFAEISPRWSPDWSKIAFVSNKSGCSNIWIMDSSGQNDYNLTNKNIQSIDPCWSRDGTKIYFSRNTLYEDISSCTPCRYYEIYVFDLLAATETRLTNNSYREMGPIVSPDGDFITYVKAERANDCCNQTDVWLMNADGSNQRFLYGDPSCYEWPAYWGKNNNKILFGKQYSFNSLFEIVYMNPDGSDLVRLTYDNYYDYPLSFSPDETKILFKSNRGGNYDLWVMNIDGTNLIQLTNDVAEEFGGDWKAGSIIINNPIITSLSPTSGPVGTVVTISGTNFGTAFGIITINGMNASIISWSDTQIKTAVPSGASTGPVVVHKEGGLDSNAVTFTVSILAPPPQISSLSPNSGPVGTAVSISGINFDSTLGAVTFSGIDASITIWSNSQIQTTVPSGASTGSVVVHSSNGLDSNGVIFTVTVPILPDLSVYYIDFGQSVWNPDINGDAKVDLVKGKSVMARVFISCNNKEYLPHDASITVEFRYQDRLFRKSISYTQFMLRDFIDFPFIPNGSGDQTVYGKVDPFNTINESNEQNNEKTGMFSVKKTKGLYIAYLPNMHPKNNTGYGPLSLLAYENAVAQAGQFIAGTYPVADSELVNNQENFQFIGSDKRGDKGESDDCKQLWKLGKKLTAGLADTVVGIVPENYFVYHENKSDLSGVCFAGCKAVLARVDTTSTTAHEIGHTFDLWTTGPEEYDIFYPGKDATGYWMNKGREITNGVCFMGIEGQYQMWIDNDDYASLFRELRVDKSDPEIILVSGYIYRDGRVEFDEIYRLEQGIEDSIKLGDYSILILDKDNLVIKNIPFYTSFNKHIDPIGNIETDFAMFTLAIPFPENTSKIQLLHESNVLAEFNPNIKLLHDAIDLIPNSGFKINAIQRRNALHNKIDEVEMKILDRDYADAINKLNNDIRDKFEKWLLDDYLKETPLQISKTEIIELVDEIINRLSKEL
jgi:Tol biopolymer transport system component